MNLLLNAILGAYVLIVLARVPELFSFLAPLQLGKLVFALGMLLVLATQPRRLFTLWHDVPFGRYLLLLALAGACSVPFSVWRGGALADLLGYLKTLGGFLLVFVLAEQGREHILRLAILASVAILAILLLLDTGTGRLHVSTSYDPNDMALLFVVFMPIVVAEALCATPVLRIPAWGIAICSVVGIALTQSRGGVLALAAVGTHALLVHKKRRWLLVPLFCMGAALIVFFAEDTLWSRFHDLQSESDYNYSAKDGRLEIWTSGLSMLATHPLFGVGIGQFSAALGMIGSGAYKTAHNSFLQLGVELGLFGFVVFLALLRSVFRMARAGAASMSLPPACRIRHSALLLGLTGYCVGGFFLSQAYGNILYMLLALAAVMHSERIRLENAATILAQEQTPHTLQPTPASASARKPAVAAGLAQRAEAVRRRRAALLAQGSHGPAQHNERQAP